MIKYINKIIQTAIRNFRINLYCDIYDLTHMHDVHEHVLVNRTTGDSKNLPVRLSL